MIHQIVVYGSFTCCPRILLINIHFVYHPRRGAAGRKEQKVGLGVRQDKEHHSFVSSKDNVDSRISMQVIQTRLKS